jgi:hypothetical protein
VTTTNEAWPNKSLKRLFKVKDKNQRKKMESERLESHLLNKQEEEASSFTSGLLLSTSVVVAGSFCYGCAVRSLPFSLNLLSTDFGYYSFRILISSCIIFITITYFVDVIFVACSVQNHGRTGTFRCRCKPTCVQCSSYRSKSFFSFKTLKPVQ